MKKFKFLFILSLLLFAPSYATQKVAIYQGSFNPLTKGHEAIMRALLEEYDVVYVTPDQFSIYKEVAPFKIRNKMIKSAGKRLESERKDKLKSHKILTLSEKDLKIIDNTIKAQKEDLAEMWDINNFIMQKYSKTTNTEFYNVVGADTLTWLCLDPFAKKYSSAGNLAKMKLIVLDRPFTVKEQKFDGYQSAQKFFTQQGCLSNINGSNFFNNQQMIIKKDLGISEISSTKVKSCLKSLKSMTNFNRIPNANEMSQLSLSFKGKYESAVISKLNELLSVEVLNILNTLDPTVAKLYYEKSDSNKCV